MYSRLNLILTAIVFIGFGAWGFLDPGGMLEDLGATGVSASGKTAIRAIYGGFLCGSGAFFLYCSAKSERVSIGLICLLMVVGTILAARVSGFTIDRGALGLQAWYLGIEAVSVIVTSALLLVRRRSTP